MGSLEFAEKRTESALAYLRKVEQADPRQPALHILLGRVYARMRHWTEAERAFRNALAMDEENPYAWQGLALACLGLGRNQEAVEHTLKAVDLLHHFPLAHYHLGIALSRLNRPGEAVQALETCLSINPAMTAAHRRLASIYQWQVGDLAKSVEHRLAAQQARHVRLSLS